MHCCSQIKEHAQGQHEVDDKRSIIKRHVSHGVELHQTNHKGEIAEFRCEKCNRHLCWASAADVKTWQKLGAKVKPKVPAKDNLRLVSNTGGTDED